MTTSNRRILVPVTDELGEAFAEFRRINNTKSWPESKLYRAFAEAGMRVWRHEQARASQIVQKSAPKSPPNVPVAADNFPFANQVVEAQKPAPVAVSSSVSVPDDGFPFEGVV